MLAPLPGRVVAVLGAGAWSVDLTSGSVNSHTGPQRPRIRGTAIPATDGVLLLGGFDRRTFGVAPERLVLR